MLKILLVLAAIWLVFTVLGFLIEGLIWLTVLGVVLLLGTAAYGFLKRDAAP